MTTEKIETRAFDMECDLILPCREEIEDALGYGAGKMPGYFVELATDALKQAAALCRVRATYVELDKGEHSTLEGWIDVGGRRFTLGPRIARRLGAAARIGVFACTIGPGLGDRARKSMEAGETIEAYILDAIASQAAENTAEALQKTVEESAAQRGLGATERYSPGYCGWPVSEQELLFSLLPPLPCGIELTSSSMMRPEKSVSGIFGLGPGLTRSSYGCNDCDREACPSRAGIRPKWPRNKE